MAEILAQVRAFIPEAAGVCPDDDFPMLGRWADAPAYWLSPSVNGVGEYRDRGSVGAAVMPASDVVDFMEGVVPSLRKLADFRLRVGLRLPPDGDVEDRLLGKTRLGLWPIVGHRLKNLPSTGFDQRIHATLDTVESAEAAAAHLKLVLAAAFVTEVALVETPEGKHVASVAVSAPQSESLELLTQAALDAFTDHGDKSHEPLPPRQRIVAAYGPLSSRADSARTTTTVPMPVAEGDGSADRRQWSAPRSGPTVPSGQGNFQGS